MKRNKKLSDLGVRIRALRTKRKMTQQKLAAECNFEKGNLCRIEAGRKNVSYLTLCKIANGLQVPLSELLSGLPVA